MSRSIGWTGRTGSPRAATGRDERRPGYRMGQHWSATIPGVLARPQEFARAFFSVAGSDLTRGGAYGARLTPRAAGCLGWAFFCMGHLRNQYISIT